MTANRQNISRQIFSSEEEREREKKRKERKRNRCFHLRKARVEIELAPVTYFFLQQNENFKAKTEEKRAELPLMMFADGGGTIIGSIVSQI